MGQGKGEEAQDQPAPQEPLKAQAKALSSWPSSSSSAHAGQHCPLKALCMACLHGTCIVAAQLMLVSHLVVIIKCLAAMWVQCIGGPAARVPHRAVMPVFQYKLYHAAAAVVTCQAW